MIPAIMPITGSILSSEIPFQLLVPHELQSLRNHGIPLALLAQRGGLSVNDATSILDRHDRSGANGSVEAEFDLINKVRAWRASASAPPMSIRFPAS